MSSATLAWGESYYLNAYVKMYRVTRYMRWLDKVVDHFDRIVTNMSDHDGDGIPGWHTGLVFRVQDAGPGAAQPGDGVDQTRRGHGHEY